MISQLVVVESRQEKELFFIKLMTAAEALGLSSYDDISDFLVDFFVENNIFLLRLNDVDDSDFDFKHIFIK